MSSVLAHAMLSIGRLHSHQQADFEDTVMAHAARSNDEIPRPPMARPNFGLLGWVLFGLAVAAALAYGFLRARGPTLTGPGVPLERPPGGVRVWSSVAELGSGKIGPTVMLADVPRGTGVIGIGSLSELRGEIAIVRGQRWVSYALPGGATRTQRLDAEPAAQHVGHLDAVTIEPGATLRMPRASAAAHEGA